MHVDAVDLGRELRQGVEAGLDCSPVVFGSPVLAHLAEPLQRHSLLDAIERLALRPASGGEAGAKVFELGLGDRVTFHGWVDEQAKHEILARSWVHLCPSVKEGWGIVVMEAGAHGVPTVAYHAAGGVGESILDGKTGLLADDLDGFVAAVENLLRSDMRRNVLGLCGRQYVAGFEWENSVRRFDRVVRGVLRGQEIETPRRATAVT